MKASLVFLALAALLGSAACFPNFWPGNVDDGALCDDHPTGPFKGHGETSRDKTIKIAITSDGKKVKKFCPGEEYTVTVTFEEPRKAVLTATGGEFDQEDEVDTLEDCETRKNFLGDVENEFETLESYTTEWKAPCDAKKVTFKTTSAAGAASPYLWNTKKMKSDKKCEASDECEG